MGSHQRFQRFTVRRQNNQWIGGQQGITTSSLSFRFVMPQRRRFDSCFVAESSLAQTTFVPSRKTESQLPLGGTRAFSD